jgi:hypothetical protein
MYTDRANYPSSRLRRGHHEPVRHYIYDKQFHKSRRRNHIDIDYDHPTTWRESIASQKKKWDLGNMRPMSFLVESSSSWQKGAAAASTSTLIAAFHHVDSPKRESLRIMKHAVKHSPHPTIDDCFNYTSISGCKCARRHVKLIPQARRHGRSREGRCSCCTASSRSESQARQRGRSRAYR